MILCQAKIIRNFNFADMIKPFWAASLKSLYGKRLVFKSELRSFIGVEFTRSKSTVASV